MTLNLTVSTWAFGAVVFVYYSYCFHIFGLILRFRLLNLLLAHEALLTCVANMPLQFYLEYTKVLHPPLGHQPSSESTSIFLYHP